MQDFGMGSRKSAKGIIQIAEHVYLKPAATGNALHYYFTLNGHQFRASTKTSDKLKATRIALNAYHEARYNFEVGQITERVSFRKLAKRYLVSLEGQTRQKYHRETLHRHLMDFFGPYDDIAKINQGTLNDYLSHRKEKSGHTILNQTLNRENGVLNQMLKFASDYEWISKPLKIKHQSEAQTYNRRPHFTRNQYETLIKTSQLRIDSVFKDAKNAKEAGLLTVKHWNRCLLHEIIIIIANTGLRVDEIKAVRWKDINWEQREINLHKAGKTKSSRVMHMREDACLALERIKKRRVLFLEKENELLDEADPVQCLPNGQFIKSMKRGFNELLKECGFVYASVKDKHSLTSLRHTYATFRLTDKTGKRASARALSKQMGTSEKMIEKHYGHDDVRDYKDIL